MFRRCSDRPGLNSKLCQDSLPCSRRQIAAGTGTGRGAWNADAAAWWLPAHLQAHLPASRLIARSLPCWWITQLAGGLQLTSRRCKQKPCADEKQVASTPLASWTPQASGLNSKGILTKRPAEHDALEALASRRSSPGGVPACWCRRRTGSDCRLSAPPPPAALPAHTSQ